MTTTMKHLARKILRSCLSSVATANKLQITQPAMSRIRQLDALLRVRVDSGGCHGFQYQFDVVAKPEHDDLVFRTLAAPQAAGDGALDLTPESHAGQPVVVVDAVSYPFIKGACIDY